MGGNQQANSKLTEKCRGSRSKTIVKRNERNKKVGWLFLLHTKTARLCGSIEKTGTGQKNRPTEQNRTEPRHGFTYTYKHLNYNKGSATVQQGKGDPSFQ